MYTKVTSTRPHNQLRTKVYSNAVFVYYANCLAKMLHKIHNKYFAIKVLTWNKLPYWVLKIQHITNYNITEYKT